MNDKKSARIAALPAAGSLGLQPFAATIAAAQQTQGTATPSTKSTAKPPTQTAGKPATTPTQPSTAKPATAPAAGSATSAPIDGGWPRVLDVASGGSLL